MNINSTAMTCPDIEAYTLIKSVLDQLGAV